MSLSENEISSIFRTLLLAEIEAGTEKALSEYQDLFPGFEDKIAELYERMNLESSSTMSEASADVIFKLAGPGDRVAHYRLVAEIGRGGQAVVFSAQDEKHNRTVAVKLLTRIDLGSNSTLKRFQREAELCSKINHPSICAVYDSGIHDGTPYIAMELVEGGTVAHQISKSRLKDETIEDENVFFDSIPAEQETPAPAPGAASSKGDADTLPGKAEIRAILSTFAMAAEALHAAHQQGIIHRDIKPGNVMIRTNGVPVILDFGLAHDTDSDRADLTQTGDFFGTPAYMSPEQLSAHRIRLDHRTDIFSLAVSLYEAVTLVRPFAASTREEIYQAILTKEPVDPRKLNPAVNRDLAVVIGKAMEKDRDQRYPDAAGFARDLRNILEFRPIEARPASFYVKAVRWTQRNKVMASALAILPIIAIITVLITNQIQKRQEKKKHEKEVAAQWKDLKTKFNDLVDAQKNNLLTMILQPKSVQAIEQHVAFLGEDAHAWIREKLNDKSARVRQAAISLIMETKDAGAADLLLDHCLNDEDTSVKIWCSQAMFRIPDDRLIPHLWTIVRSSDIEACRVNAIFGLVAFKADGAVKACLEFFHDPKSQPSMKYALATNALMLGVPGMESMAESLRKTLRPDDPQGWGAVVEYYRLLDTKESIAKLEEIGKDEKSPPMIRRFVENTLAERSNRLAGVRREDKNSQKP